MLQVILVAIAVLVALSYIFASVAGDAGADHQPAAKKTENAEAQPAPSARHAA